jgi:hypothetical protein
MELNQDDNKLKNAKDYNEMTINDLRFGHG